MTNAIAFVPQGWPSYKSQIEEDWSIYGAMILADEFGKRTNILKYEPLSFNLPGGKYTPDFMHLLEDGRVIFVETKQSKHQKNYRDARSKLRTAAELHPWFVFIEAIGKGDNWTVEVI